MTLYLTGATRAAVQIVFSTRSWRSAYSYHEIEVLVRNKCYAIGNSGDEDITTISSRAVVF
jgi:hypothetical protein